jgi:hypothetical protein
MFDKTLKISIMSSGEKLTTATGNPYKADPEYGTGVANALGMTMDEVNNFSDPRLLIEVR